MAFRDNFDGTELIKEVEVTGDRFVNRQLTVTMELNEAYPVPVRVACYYENQNRLSKDERKVAFHERATLIGQQMLEPTPTGRPDEKVERSSVSFEFTVSEPGDYFLACITPAAPDNGIGKRFRVRSAGAASGS